VGVAGEVVVTVIVDPAAAALLTKMRRTIKRLGRRGGCIMNICRGGRVW
jgi:hypothetical protein